MDKIEKFLKSLSKKDRKYLKNSILPKILSLDLKGLDVKKIRGLPVWRIRHGKIRILFMKTDSKGVLVRMGLRKDVYKDL